MFRLNFLSFAAVLFGLFTVTPARAGYDACARLATGEFSLNDIGDAKDFVVNHSECIDNLVQLAVPTDPVSIITYALIGLDAGGAFGNPDGDTNAQFNSCVGLIPQETLKLVEDVLKALGKSLPDSIQKQINSKDPNALNSALAFAENNVPGLSAALGQLSCACAVATSGIGGKIADIVNDVISCGTAFADTLKAAWNDLKSIAKCGEYIITLGLAGSCGGSDDGPPPPTVIDCTRQGLPYDMYYDGIQYTALLDDKGGGTYYSPDYNEACVCPAPMVMVSSGETDPRYMTCVCPIEGEVAAIPGVCKCPDGQSLVALDGNKSAPAFCGICPAGATNQDGYCTSCPAGKVPWYAFKTAAYPQFYLPTPDNFCFSCGPHSHPDAAGQGCVACAADEYVDGNFSCSKCAAQNGEYLNASGTACVSQTSCAAGMSLVPIHDGVGYTPGVAGFACGCLANSVPYKGTCVPQLTCDGSSQIADYDTNSCVNACPRGTIRVNHGGKEVTEWRCDSCAAGTYSNNNTCNTCPAGTKSDGNNNCVPECGIAGYAYDASKNACEFCGTGKQVLASQVAGNGYSITQSYCADCPAGTMSDNTGACVACGGGNSVVIGNSCTICKPWQKVHNGGGLFDGNSCEDTCQGGVYVDDGDNCHYDPVARKQVCAPVCGTCGENSYVEDNVCHSCGTTGIADDYGNTCQLCSPGTVAKNVGARISCVASCAEVGSDAATRADYITDPENLQQCLKCPEGSSPNQAHSACSVCSPGYVWASTLMQCVSMTRPPVTAEVATIHRALLHVPGPPPATTETLLFPGETLPSPACPSGLAWDGRTCLHAPVPPPICKPGTSWDGHACVARPAFPLCPAGTHWDNRSCVPKLAGSLVCPANSHSDGTRCVANDRLPLCPLGSVWNGLTCATAAQPACPPNASWNGARCVAGLARSSCPDDAYWDGSRCTTNQAVTRCAAGARWDGSRCVPAGSATPNCPPDSTWDGARCVAVQPSRTACPPGTRWDGHDCFALAPAPPPTYCPPNMRWNGIRCVLGGMAQLPPRVFLGARAPGIPLAPMRPGPGPYMRPGGFRMR
jgi:hypothetical protein